MERISLSNNLCVIIHPMNNTHSVTLGLYVKAGVAYNEPMNGIAHLLEHMHFRCLDGMTQHDLYYKMESIGSTLCATTYKDFIKFSMKVVPCFLSDALDIFSKIIDTKMWDQASVDAEKKVVLNQILETDGYASIDKEVQKVVYRDHPLSNSIIGSAEQLDKIKPSDLAEYKKSVFNRERVLFCATGNITIEDQQQIKAKLEKCALETSDIPKTTMSKPKHFCKRSPSVNLVLVKDDGLLDVNISFDIEHVNCNRDVLTILNCVLGEGVGSRLQMCIRERKNYSSNIYSYTEQFGDFAELHIRFSVDEKNLLQCITDLSYVLMDLMTNVTERDLDVSLPFYTVNQAFTEDDTEEMNFQIGYSYLILGREYAPITLEKNQQTMLEIQNLAREIFKLNNLSIVILGNTKHLTKKAIINSLKLGVS